MPALRFAAVRLGTFTAPVLAIASPVSAGAAPPAPNNRLSVPEGEAVLFPAGSACQRKSSLTAVATLLLKEDAERSSGSELAPAAAVAVPMAGNSAPAPAVSAPLKLAAVPVSGPVNAAEAPDSDPVAVRLPATL